MLDIFLDVAGDFRRTLFNEFLDLGLQLRYHLIGLPQVADGALRRCFEQIFGRLVQGIRQIGSAENGAGITRLILQQAPRSLA